MRHRLAYWQSERRGRAHKSVIGSVPRLVSRSLLGVAICLVAATAAAETSEARIRDYSGHVVGDPDAAVSFRVKIADGERKRATFRAENIVVPCDDGTSERSTFPPLSVAFRGRNAFRGDDYLFSSTVEQYYEIAGRLLSRGRAKGFLFFISDQSDPPDDPAFFADCSTAAKVRWTARRGS